LELNPEVLGRLTKLNMGILYNTFMSKASVLKKEEVAIPAKNPFSGFSRFGGKPTDFNGPKFSPKTFPGRPGFVTQHKGGGGK
jgi:hypothetical protein